VLLIGTLGTGKRPLANYLVVEHGFVHLDLEDDEVREVLLGGTGSELRESIAALAGAGRGLVVTWSAGDSIRPEDVRRLQEQGIEAVWFDSDRGTAFGAYFAGSPESLHIRLVDPFEADGRFRSVEAIADDVLRR
jgi:hypothetical protein